MTVRGYPFPAHHYKVIGINFSWGIRLDTVWVGVLRRAAVSYELRGNETSVRIARQ